jgi:hypothetical protein
MNMPYRMNLDKNLAEKAILYGLIAGAVVLSPMGGKVVICLAKHYVKKWWDEGGPYVPPENDPEMVRKSLYKLKRNNYVNWKYNKAKNVVELSITEKGKINLRHARFSNISISTADKWDGQWRFFMFDIPEKKKGLREILRDKLKSLGFFRFQKSVWVHPFECEKEVRDVCEYLDVVGYTTMFTAKIDRDRVLRRYFLKQGVLLRKHLSLADKGVRY